MLKLNSFEYYEKSEIRSFRVYPSLKNEYFIVTSAGEFIVGAYHARLINQRQSQKQSSKCPEGYLLLEIASAQGRFNLATMMLETPKIRVQGVHPNHYTRIKQRRVPAAIAKAPEKGSEAWLLLQKLCQRTSLRESIRRAVGASVERLVIVVDLLRVEHLGQTPHRFGMLYPDLVKAFDFYLHEVSPKVLNDILSLLEMKNEFPKRTAA